jgi:hypothetical protein
MACALKSKVSIISGIPEANIDDYWLKLADDWVKALLNRTFAATASAIQYVDMRTRNDYKDWYDGRREVLLEKMPVLSLTSVIKHPDSTSPETLVSNTNYFLDLETGILTFADDETISVGQRVYKITYTHGYASAPDIVKEYANYWAAFMLESNPAKNDDGKILKEIEIGRYREAYGQASAYLQAKYSLMNKLEQIIIDKYKVWE